LPQYRLFCGRDLHREGRSNPLPLRHTQLSLTSSIEQKAPSHSDSWANWRCRPLAYVSLSSTSIRDHCTNVRSRQCSLQGPAAPKPNAPYRGAGTAFPKKRKTVGRSFS
jgi:hypothetical protein